jgi:hypothetical protein
MPLMKPTDIIFRIGISVQWTAVSSGFFSTENCLVRFITKPRQSTDPANWNITIAPFVVLPTDPPLRTVLNPFSDYKSSDDIGTNDGFVYLWIDGDVCYPWHVYADIDSKLNEFRWRGPIVEGTIFWGERLSDVNFKPM